MRDGDWLPILLWSLLAVGVAALLVATLILLALRKKLLSLRVDGDLPLGALLRRTPFLLVVALDLLDLGLDMLSAPIVWAILHRLGMGRLRNLATVVALIPGTQFIPALTLGWVIARYAGPPADRLLDDLDRRGSAPPASR